MEDDFYDEEDEMYFDSPYGPPRRRGRLRFFPKRRMGPPRSFTGRFVRTRPSAVDEEEEIEALIEQHLEDKRRRQEMAEYEDQDGSATNRNGKGGKTATRPLKESQKKSIRDVIHLEDVASMKSSTWRSERTGSW